MNRYKLILILSLVITGVVIVALPDRGERLFSLSAHHGPSRQDVLGLIFILGPYIYLVITTWKNRERFRPYQDSNRFKVGLFLLGLGTGLVMASVMGDFPYWWVCGAILMLLVQIPFFFIGLK